MARPIQGFTFLMTRGCLLQRLAFASNEKQWVRAVVMTRAASSVPHAFATFVMTYQSVLKAACLIADHLAKGIVRDKVFPNSVHDKLDGTSKLVPAHGIFCDILAMVLDIACDNVLNPAVHCERHHRHRLGASADNLHDKFLL
eukprot:CAMPEP_0169405310 /NCGR_PEP_ID=MMETSP1017-20121227/56860_1 /TAXON_ID=342587 /ORGANISM="Karlodinium micrum, Strain CCMP2283" /LENGTH=142 /DNA_ID=CAMNT_0009511861 /DNA_START=131 /DNA_END=558 /DNA_ORIENTATION=-